MSDILNPLAELDRVDSGQYRTPEEAKRDHDHKYFCPDPECLDETRRLIFKISNKDRPFFCHHPKFEHEIRPETLLHKLVIKAFERLDSFEIPAFRNAAGNYYGSQVISIDASKTAIEYREHRNIRPDVSITTSSGIEIAIEVFVTIKTKTEKIGKIKSLGLPAIEIDLSKFYFQYKERCKSDIAFIRENALPLINDLSLKHWLHKLPTDSCAELVKSEEPTKGEPVKSESITSSNSGCFVALILLPFFLLFGQGLSNKLPRKRIRRSR